MNTLALGTTLHTLFAELLDGPSPSGAYLLNRCDSGLLASLARLPASAASAPGSTGSTIAAHVAHLGYGLSLMNRWADGEQPFGDADWSASWRSSRVTEAEWLRLRGELEEQGQRWLQTLGAPRELSQEELTGMVASMAHLAYHLGAIRQIAPATRGPMAND